MDGFKVRKRSFYNSKGSEVSEEIYQKEYKTFEEDRNKTYNAIIKTIISEIPGDISDKEKLELLYKYLVSNINYDYQVLEKPSHDGHVYSVYYPFKDWGNFKISSSEKYGTMILKIGICEGIAKVFEDIANMIGISCKTINGKTKIINEETGVRLGHCWNMIHTQDGEKHIDVTYGIFNKDKKDDEMNYFYLSSDELKQIGPHCNFENFLTKK